MVAQTSDQSDPLLYDIESGSWVKLDGSDKNPATKGIRIANKLATVDMLELPIQNAEDGNE